LTAGPHLSSQVKWDFSESTPWTVSRAKIAFERGSKPRRSALKNTAVVPAPLSSVDESKPAAAPDSGEVQPAGGDAAGRQKPRFSIKKVSEPKRDQLSLLQLKHSLEKLTNGDGQNGHHKNYTPLPDTDSGASSDAPTTDSVTTSPLGVSTSGGRGRRRSLPDASTGTVTDSEVYSSLVSESSRTTRLRDGLAKVIRRRAATMDFEARKQNAEQRLQRQFSISDLHQG